MMLRNRSKISRRRHLQNVRKRNSTLGSRERSNSSLASSSSSIDWNPNCDDSVESSDENSNSPVIRARSKRKLTIKSKRSRTKNGKNRSKFESTKWKTNNQCESNLAGPSNQNLRGTRSQNSNKRKLRERRNQTQGSESDSCSSDGLGNMQVQVKKQRMRQNNSICSSDSDEESSLVRHCFRRRPIVESGSSSSSDVIIQTGRRRMILTSESSTSSSDLFLNTEDNSTSTEDSSGSPVIRMTSRVQAVNRLRSMNLNSTATSSSSSSSSFSIGSALVNVTSVPESETSSYNTANSNSCIKDPSSDSDSSDSDGEKCAICLKKFKYQLVGNPSNCDHNFCAPCLKKWSESSTTCPVDRSTFDAIVIKTKVDGPTLERVKVENRNFGIFPPLDVDDVLLNDTINCEICGSGDDEETLLLCDFCNLGYHMACLIPPLQAIPAGSWYCPPCTEMHSNPSENMNEAIRLLFNGPMRPSFVGRRRTGGRAPRYGRTPPSGPLPHGRGPSTMRGFRSHNSESSGFQDFSIVIESMTAHLNSTLSASQSRKKRRKPRRRNEAVRGLQPSSSVNVEQVEDGKERIIKRMNQRRTVVNSQPMTRPRGPNEVTELVFPSFSLFGNEELDYFSDDDQGHDIDGEVAIMARVRNAFSARSALNRKNIVSALSNQQGRANVAVEEIQETSTSINLLDSILENQELWHSKNVEIYSKKDGTLEIKKKDGEKPDLTNTNHSSKEIPLYPNKNENTSDNKSYTNTRYSSLGSNNNGGNNTFSPSTSSFNSLNPSTRPGFSNLLGNNSAALDLSPFRGAAPIRFRMNPPRPAMKRPNYNANSQRQSAVSSTSLMNSVQSPKKTSNTDDDVDLYDDIDTENVEPEKSQEIFSSLEPPPEPPALLIGSDSSSDDENNGLVIDDKIVSSANKSNIYDPTDPNEDSDDGCSEKDSMVPGYLRSPSYGGLSEFGPHLPLPEPPALPIELDSVKDSDEEEEAECPNMTLYSSTSINLANNVQDIPIPETAYPANRDELDFIPIPNNDETPLPEEEKAEIAEDEKVYSLSKSDTSSVGYVEDSRQNSTPRDRSNSESRSIRSERMSKSNSSAEESSNDESKKFRKKGRKSRRDYFEEKKGKMFSDSDLDDNGDKKEIDLTEIDSNDGKVEKIRMEEDSEGQSDDASIKEEENHVFVSADKNYENETDTGNEPKPHEFDICKRTDDQSDSDEEHRNKNSERTAIEIEDTEKSDDIGLENGTDGDICETAVDDDSGKANSADVTVSNYLLPSEDLDPVSDIEYNDFPDCHRSSSSKDKRKKRRRTRKRDSSSDNKVENKELEEGEIEEEKIKRKYASQRRRDRSESVEHSSERKLKKKRDRKEKSTGKENKGSYTKSNEDFTWKKLSKSTKERNYRDGKTKPGDKSSERNKERDAKNKKEKRKEIERYDVRKIVSDKPRPVRDEFGRDISVNRSRSRTPGTRSRSTSYSGRRRSKGGTLRRSFSQDDRWIDWSPVWTQRRSRSRTRRSKSRSRNRSRLSSDRYRNRSKNRDREYDKRDSRKRRRSLSSEIEKYSPPSEMKKRRRSRDQSRKSESYIPLRTGRELADYYYDRSWSRSISYASLTPEPEPYVRYSRSPSILEQPGRIPLISPDRDHDLLTPNPQNLTVIVPNIDITKKKHKRKKEGKKKKKKQPSKEVFTSGDNIVVSVNFDDNQKIISAKSSKRKHQEEEKTRKKKKDESRKKRKQTLQVSEEVLNAKPVAVIDLNSSPCKEMSPTEVISLTDSGDENNANENVIPADRRISQEYVENYPADEEKGKSPERRAYVMTLSGPKTPPEPPIKFTVNSTAPMRPLPTNPIFEQDEIDQEEDLRYNKGPDTPSEPANQIRRSSISPNTTMYDPFEPTKSRSQSPENTELYEERKDATPEERRPVLDMFADDNDKPQENQNTEKTKSQEDSKENTSPTVPDADEPQTNTSFSKTSPVKETSTSESTNETNQSNGVNTLVLDLSSLGDDFVPKSSIPLVKTSQGKYEFQSGKAPDKPITVVISQQSQPAKPQPQQVMVTPTRQVPTKPVEPIKQPVFPDILPWKLPPPISQPSFSTPPAATSLPSSNIVTPSKSASGMLAQNGNQEESSFELDDSPYSPASSEGDDLFEPPPLNASSSPNKQRPSPMPAVNSYKSRVDSLFSSSPIKKIPPRTSHVSKPVSAIKGTKKVTKNTTGGKKEVTIKADEEQLKILDDVPNSAVEMLVKEKFLKKLHRQERVVEEVKVVLKPHYAKKHINKEEYKDILRKAVPKICHNKSGDINPSKIQSLVEAYVKKIRYSKKKPSGSGQPLFPPMQSATKPMKKQKTLWG